MKHPVLVRFFAVVLTIVYLTMLGAGIMGLQNAEKDYKSNVSAVNKMQADLDEYIMLLAENEGKEPYDSVNEALADLKDKHEDTAAEHRTELATYTATKGGIQTGVEALDQADAMMADARWQFETQKKKLEDTYAQMKALQAAYTQYSALPPQYYESLTMAQQVMIGLANLPAGAGSASAGSSSGDTGDGDTGDGDTGDGDTGDGDTGNGDTGDGDTGDGDTGNGDTGNGDTGDGDTGNGDTGDGDTGNGDTGNGDTGDGDTGDGGTDDGDTGAMDEQLNLAYNNAITAGNFAMQVLGVLGEAGQQSLLAVSGAVNSLTTADPRTAANYEENAAVLKRVGTEMSAGLSEMISGIDALKQAIKTAEENGVDMSKLDETIAAMETGLAAMKDGEKQLKDAEKALYDSRAQIWYEMGKLENQKAELEVTRDELLQEEQEIISKEQLSEEQKERERQLKRLYLTFLEKPEVEEAVDEGEDFAAAVEAHIAKFNKQIHEENTYRGYACILMIVAALPCLICFLASFEIIKKLGFVRSAALMLLLCAVAALCMLNYMGMGISYSAAAVMIFAVLQILVSGRKKKIKVK